MPYKPRTEDQIYNSLRNGLTDRIAKLTNFVETSFNYVWTRAFSRRFRDNEIALLAAQTAGWVEYAGGPITQDDLDSLGVSSVDPERVNEFVDDEDLDSLVEIVGVERQPGEPAQGQVTFTTVDSFTEIPAGTSVGTAPDSSGNFFEYTTDETVSTSTGDNSVTVGITAEAVGEEYNVGTGQITYLINPPTGVESVGNTDAITGGSDIETNDELRTRAKNAIFNKSGGGTAEGVRGFVNSNAEDVTSVSVAEYPGGNNSLATDSPSPGGPGGSNSTAPFADVIVEGGQQADIEDSIKDARPVAIQHNFVRPTLIEVNITVDVIGSNIDTAAVEESVRTYINSLDLGESVFRDKIIQRALNADEQVENITDLNVAISNESIIFDNTQDIYLLSKGVQMENDGITEVTGQDGGTNVTFTEGTDYNEIDNDTDGSDDSIDWSVGGVSPDDGTNFFVTYDIIDDIPVDQYEKGDANSVNVNVV